MGDGRTAAVEGYFVSEDRLVFVRFSRLRPAGRSVVLAEPPTRDVDGASGEPGPLTPSRSDVMVVASYSANDELVKVEILGVPKRRPTDPPG
jgi:hypothetical protein